MNARKPSSTPLMLKGNRSRSIMCLAGAVLAGSLILTPYPGVGSLTASAFQDSSNSNSRVIRKGSKYADQVTRLIDKADSEYADVDGSVSDAEDAVARLMARKDLVETKKVNKLYDRVIEAYNESDLAAQAASDALATAEAAAQEVQNLLDRALAGEDIDPVELRDAKREASRAARNAKQLSRKAESLAEKAERLAAKHAKFVIKHAEREGVDITVSEDENGHKIIVAGGNPANDPRVHVGGQDNQQQQNQGNDNGDDDGPLPKPVITLLGSESDRLAPHTVHVHATESSLGDDAFRWQRTKFEWDFGDKPEYTKTTTDPRNGNLVNLSTQQQGFNAAYIYEAPGTYTITLTMTNEAGQSASVQEEVTILPDTRIVKYVDAQSGSDNNLGTSPSDAWRTVDRALENVQSNSTILFKRGQVFEVTEDQRIGRERFNVVLGAYGNGAKPIIRWTGPNDGQILATDGWNYSAENIMIRDLAFETIYDWQTSEVEAVAMQGRGMTVWNCNLQNFKKCVNLQTSHGFYALNSIHGPTTRYSWVILNSESAVITGCVGEESLYERTIRMFPTNGNEKLPNLRISLCWNLFSDDGVRFEAVKWATSSCNKWDRSAVELGHQDNHAEFILFSKNLISSNEGADSFVLKPAVQNAMLKNNVWMMSHQYRRPIMLYEAYSTESSVANIEIYNNSIIYKPGIGLRYDAAPFSLRSDIEICNFQISNNLVVGGSELCDEMFLINDAPSAFQFTGNVLKPLPAKEGWAWIDDQRMSFFEWSSKPFVAKELQADIPPSSLSAPGFTFPSGFPAVEAHGEMLPGLFEDYNGVPYPRSGPITPGAAQRSSD